MYCPVQNLIARASEASGVSHELAFALDGVRMGRNLADYTIMQLCEYFYTRVYDDKQPWFRDLFEKEKEESIQDLSDYILQRIGGKQNYSERKGLPSLICRHANVKFTEAAVERWLEHMSDALDDMDREISEKETEMLTNFFRHTAYMILLSQEQMAAAEKLMTDDPFPHEESDEKPKFRYSEDEDD